MRVPFVIGVQKKFTLGLEERTDGIGRYLSIFDRLVEIDDVRVDVG
jgi:hypothetical protein